MSVLREETKQSMGERDERLEPLKYAEVYFTQV